MTYFPSRPASGEVLTPKVICKVGSSTFTRGRALGSWGEATVSPISIPSSPTTAADFAGVDLVDLLAAEVLEEVDRDGLGGRDSAAGLHQDHVLPLAERARLDPADGDPAHVVRPVEGGDEHLQRLVQVDLRAGDFLQHHVHQRLHRRRSSGRGRRWRSPPCAGEDVGKVGQHVVGAQFQEQLEDFVEDFVGPGVGPVDLVDHHDRPQSALEGLREHEPRLGHGPFGGVDQHQRAVGHPQHPLHLAAEIGVAGRVDEVDLHALVGDGDVLRRGS